VKQSRPNYPVPPVIVPKYSIDNDICPYSCLEEYIVRTAGLRHDSFLFVSLIKPYKAVGLQTLSRWIRTVLDRSGVDVGVFKPHSPDMQFIAISIVNSNKEC